jgi:dipeptidyl aminopeptidase/acylaminoacyl peptidase
MRTVLLIIMVLTLVNEGLSQTIFSDSSYLGQTPPGNIPQVFAPGILSLDNRFETYPTFSPDGKELFFSVVNSAWSTGKILHTRVMNGAWTAIDTAVFSDNTYINWESNFSTDGNRQFFTSNRPPSGSTDIWVVDRTSDSTWASPVQLNAPVNSGTVDGSACVTSNGTIYFKSLRGGGIGGSILFKSRLVNGTYTDVENLGNILHTGPGESEPFIAPDESYMLFISKTRPGGKGGWDLWICFRKQDSSWTNPVNMGADINTADDEYGPRVTTDGKYLFFTREKPGYSMDIFWVSSGIIDSLKNSVLTSVRQITPQLIQIFSNHATEYLTVYLGAKPYKEARIRIMDLAGKTILTNTYHKLSEVEIDFKGNPNGVYLLCLNIDGDLFTNKIII